MKHNVYSFLNIYIGFHYCEYFIGENDRIYKKGDFRAVFKGEEYKFCLIIFFLK